jgi:hypothetical protein
VPADSSKAKDNAADQRRTSIRAAQAGGVRLLASCAPRRALPVGDRPIA